MFLIAQLIVLARVPPYANNSQKGDNLGRSFVLFKEGASFDTTGSGRWTTYVEDILNF